jgi:hypothetical protein
VCRRDRLSRLLGRANVTTAVISATSPRQLDELRNHVFVDTDHYAVGLLGLVSDYKLPVIKSEEISNWI